VRVTPASKRQIAPAVATADIRAAVNRPSRYSRDDAQLSTNRSISF
jgi:hypothetical protein